MFNLWPIHLAIAVSLHLHSVESFGEFAMIEAGFDKN